METDHRAVSKPSRWADSQAVADRKWDSGKNVLLLAEDGSMTWPRTTQEAADIMEEQFRLLMLGLNPLDLSRLFVPSTNPLLFSLATAFSTALISFCNPFANDAISLIVDI